MSRGFSFFFFFLICGVSYDGYVTLFALLNDTYSIQTWLKLFMNRVYLLLLFWFLALVLALVLILVLVLALVLVFFFFLKFLFLTNFNSKFSKIKLKAQFKNVKIKKLTSWKDFSWDSDSYNQVVSFILWWWRRISWSWSKLIDWLLTHWNDHAKRAIQGGSFIDNSNWTIIVTNQWLHCHCYFFHLYSNCFTDWWLIFYPDLK